MFSKYDKTDGQTFGRTRDATWYPTNTSQQSQLLFVIAPAIGGFSFLSLPPTAILLGKGIAIGVLLAILVKLVATYFDEDPVSEANETGPPMWEAVSLPQSNPSFIKHGVTSPYANAWLGRPDSMHYGIAEHGVYPPRDSYNGRGNNEIQTPQGINISIQTGNGYQPSGKPKYGVRKRAALAKRESGLVQEKQERREPRVVESQPRAVQSASHSRPQPARKEARAPYRHGDAEVSAPSFQRVRKQNSASTPTHEMKKSNGDKPSLFEKIIADNLSLRQA